MAVKSEKLIKKYDKHVKMYENNFSNPTLANWRKRIIPHAHGKVLEVGVGVGANFPFYPKENVHVTGVDFSKEMIQSAEKTARNLQIDADFLVKDVQDLQFKPNSFDCIVSTLTLCSYPNPIETLNKFNDWCRKGGKVLLLEHGLSNRTPLSVLQKMIDPLFVKIAGCHCNRNIMELLGLSSLQIKHSEKYMKDIIFLIWAEPGGKGEG